jgi:arylsulfatase A-like enzyme
MSRRLAWAAVSLALLLIVIKACYLGIPRMPGLLDYARGILAISYDDVMFATACWVAFRAALGMAGDRPIPGGLVVGTFVALAMLVCLYAAASVIAFGMLGGFLTYSLMELVGSVRMVSSSVTVYLTPRVVLALAAAPFAYLVVLWAVLRFIPPARGPRWHRAVMASAALVVWTATGQRIYATDWATHYDWRISENAPWVLASSWWQALSGGRTVRLSDKFPAADLADFEPLGLRRPAPLPQVLRRGLVAPRTLRAATSARTPNVVLIVLESVAARWTSIGGQYDTTPVLKAESAHGVLFDNFYAHVGRSSNSLASMLLSIYPRLDFRDFTEEYPRETRTSLASLFANRGFRTMFMTPSDMSWAGWRDFVRTRGFAEVRDDHDLPCSAPVSSWGVEDRCFVDGLVDFIDHADGRPFFVMGWTQQTHHPYEPTPGIPILELLKEPVPDAYDLNRYLNVLSETDRQLARVFGALRRAHLADNTLVIVVGDHGQAFGFPHDTYLQGRTVYEEDVHVPLLFWLPQRYRTPLHASTVGGQVDLAPTIAELAGVPAAADWQGSSLFDPRHPPRAYFYVAQDEFKLGVREERWKYILDLRAGAEELYDLTADPTEQHNVAAAQPERCARLRQRLAAWAEANQRQYERMSL